MKASTPRPLSGLQPFLRHVRTGHLVHHDEGGESGAQRRQVPGARPDRCSEPGGAEAEEQADAAQQVRDEPGRRVVAFEFGQGPASGQGVVDERHGCQRLQPRRAHGEQAQQAVPRGEVGLAMQVFVVGDGRHAQDGARHREALQHPVSATFCLVRKPFDGGAMGGEKEHGLCHEEGELVGKDGESKRDATPDYCHY